MHIFSCFDELKIFILKNISFAFWMRPTPNLSLKYSFVCEHPSFLNGYSTSSAKSLCSYIYIWIKLLFSNTFSYHVYSYHCTKPTRGQGLFIGCLFIQVSHGEGLPLKLIPTFKGPLDSNLAHNHFCSWREKGRALKCRPLPVLRSWHAQGSCAHIKTSELAVNKMFTVIIQDMMNNLLNIRD